MFGEPGNQKLLINGVNHGADRIYPRSNLRCSRLAIAYFEADRKCGPNFADDEATAGALLADLHRRVGDFDAARACARAGIARGPEGLLLEVLRFQVKLAESEEEGCRNLGEIEEDDEFTIILPG